jgi:hypothetical protein
MHGYDRRSAVFTGLNLDHVGEFGVIVTIEAFVFGFLIEPVFEALLNGGCDPDELRAQSIRELDAEHAPPRFSAAESTSHTGEFES